MNLLSRRTAGGLQQGAARLLEVNSEGRAAKHSALQLLALSDAKPLCLSVQTSNFFMRYSGEKITSQVQKAKSFRKLHVPSDPLILFHIWDPGTAKAVGEAGAKTLAPSRWAISQMKG